MNKLNFLASIDVDAQCCFTPLCPDELPVPDGQNIVAELNHQAQYAALRIGSKDAHPANAIWIADEQHPQLSPIAGPNVDVHWKPHAIPGTKGFTAISGLPHPADYDFFIWKGIEPDMHPYGACFHDLAEKLSTGLIEYLRAKKITHVVLGGLALDYCVKITALQLTRAGFKVILNLAATRAVASTTGELAQKELQQHGVRFINSAQELADLT